MTQGRFCFPFAGTIEETDQETFPFLRSCISIYFSALTIEIIFENVCELLWGVRVRRTKDTLNRLDLGSDRVSLESALSENGTGDERR